MRPPDLLLVRCCCLILELLSQAVLTKFIEYLRTRVIEGQESTMNIVGGISRIGRPLLSYVVKVQLLFRVGD